MDFRDAADVEALLAAGERERGSLEPLLINPLPRGWIAKVKNSMRLLCPQFSTNRMLNEYAERFYLPAARFASHMTSNALERARHLGQWKRKVLQHWPQVRIETMWAKDGQPTVGHGLEVHATVKLGPIEPKDVSLELYYGPLNAERQITMPRTVPMKWWRMRPPCTTRLWLARMQPRRLSMVISRTRQSSEPARRARLAS